MSSIEKAKETIDGMQGESVDFSRIDVWFCIRFVWNHRRVYISCVILFVAITVGYHMFCTERFFESRAVLYCPVSQSKKVKAGTNRELLDDAIAVFRQKRLLSIIAEEMQISWREVQSILNITGNQDNGIVEIVARTNDSYIAYKCVEQAVQVFGENLSDIVPLGDVILLTEPEEAKEPVANGMKLELLVGTALGSFVGSIISGRKILKKNLTFIGKNSPSS